MSKLKASGLFYKQYVTLICFWVEYYNEKFTLINCIIKAIIIETL